MINTFIVLTLWGLFYLGSLFFLSLYSGESKVRTLGKFSLFLIILSLVFYPGISGHYIFHDDVYLWAWQKTDWTTHFQYVTEGLIGRPLARILRFSIESLVDNVSDANIVRFLTIVIISLTALSLDVWFRMICGVTKSISFLLSISIVTLPPFQIYVHWMNSYPMAVAILLSVFSAILLLKPQEKDPYKFEFRTIFSSKINQERSRYFQLLKSVESKIPFSIILSFSLLICSLLTYQPAAPFFVSLLCFWLIAVDCRDVNKAKWPFLHLVIFLFAMLIYLVAFKMLVPINAMGDKSLYSNELTSDYVEKLLWFFRENMVKTLNLWNIFKSTAVASGILFIIFLGIMLELFGLGRLEDKNKSTFVRNFFWKYSAIFFLILLSSSVNLAVKQNFFTYRTNTPLIVIMFVLFWSGVQKIISVFFKKKKYEIVVTIVLFFICVCGIFSAHGTSKKYCVENNSLELKYIEEELEKKYNSNIRRIHIIRPTLATFVELFWTHNPISSFDEFGVTTSYYESDVPFLVKAAIQEKGIYVYNPRTLFVSSGEDKIFFQEPHLLIIDLSTIKYFQHSSLPTL